MENRLEAFNEMFMVFITFHVMYFSDWVDNKEGIPDLKVQYNYGLVMDGFICYYLYVNVMIILYYSALKSSAALKRMTLELRLWCFGLGQSINFEVINDPVTNIIKAKAQKSSSIDLMKP